MPKLDSNFLGSYNHIKQSIKMASFESFGSKEWLSQLKDEVFEILKTNRYGQAQRRKVSYPRSYQDLRRDINSLGRGGGATMG